MSARVQRRIQRPVRKGAALLVVVLMILAAFSLWTVVPLSWVWVGSRISATQAPSGGPYMVVLVGFVATVLVIAWVLGRLNRAYRGLTGTDTVAPIRPTWLKSMRDDSGAPAEPTVLEAVVVISVGMAILSGGAWFFLLAGSPLPNQ